MATVQQYRSWARDHPNPVTPRLLKVEQVGSYFLELSEGEGGDHEPLYGVTVLRWTGERFTPLHKLERVSASFFDREEAVKHFNNVKRLAERGDG